jgi:hypothetical protein
MRKKLVTLSLLSLLVAPMLAMAEDTTVQQSTTTEAHTNPVTEVVLLPVRLVTGVIGAPVGAVGGLITGFAKGFAWPSHSSTTATTTTTKTD